MVMFHHFSIWFLLAVWQGLLSISFGALEFVNLQFVHEPQDTLVVRGQEARFDCTYSVKESMKSIVNVTWYHNGQPMFGLNYSASNRVHLLFNNSLYIARTVQTEMDQPDIGTYHCTLHVPLVGSARSRTATLSIAYVSSVFTRQPEDKVAGINDTVVFHCEIDRLPRTDLVWYFSEHPATLPYAVPDRFPGQATLHQHGSYLEIRLATGREFGLYRCDAAVPGGRGFVQSQPARLVRRGPVHQRPSLWFEATPPARLVVTAGVPLALVCAANARTSGAEGGGGSGGGGPSVRLEWLRGSASLRLSNRLRQVGQGSLLLESLQPSDSGVYVCKASAGSSREIYTQTELTVLTPPGLADAHRPADTVAFAGGAATLRCEAHGEISPEEARQLLDWHYMCALVGDCDVSGLRQKHRTEN